MVNYPEGNIQTNNTITCECGGTYQNYHKKRHDLSKKKIHQLCNIINILISG